MRGKFIVFEGLDRSGKSTLAAKVRDHLALTGPTELICFPNRKSQIGSIINQYLNSNSEMCNEAIHLLFSANRWEVIEQVKKKLEQGINIVCDRYYYSGVAYSAAKGLDLNWCRSSDAGILQPDAVLFLEAEPEYLALRAGFGGQRFERVEFQKKVYESFKKVFEGDSEVERINVTDRSLDDLQKQVIDVVQKKIQSK